MPETDANAKNWWATMPGLLTALAGIITAVGGLIAVLVQTGLIGSRSTPAAGASATPAAQNSMPVAIVAPAASAVVAAPQAPPVTQGSMLKGLRVTAKDGSVIALKPGAQILGAALPLQNGQEVGFDRIARVEIAQPWDGSLRLLLVDGQQLEARAPNLPLSGRNELGAYLAMLSEIRSIEFIR
jgi:hypothetical protein